MLPRRATPLLRAVSRCTRNYSSRSSSSSSNPPKPATQKSAFLPQQHTSRHGPGGITNEPLPFMPSTAHLEPSDVALSSFFALHRPLSVSTPIPVPVTVDAMFSPPPPPPQHAITVHWPHPQRPGHPGTSILDNTAKEEWEDVMEDGCVDGMEPVERVGGRTKGMYAISVRRQRKLKMKKHKYKKLMKKTRNLRRKIERASK
ncbi:hypothetical protein EX30DRAFT_394595 [Ascodesmis nigricans]|uniref:Small ribosomal subunit protein mS38 n=1 Tax=Ascodesmis nigricans TaxID=341454 RepID=A0A4V3SJB7_9PEZI|nr:hypothetical protein EX30DRAFT_394595 [Ascodesmis nigricans]